MDQKTKSLLIIFYRNPKLGKVKTRLAASMGNQKALDIYRKLSLHTRSVTEGLNVDKIVFYSDAIDLMDIWPNAIYLKAMQEGEGLGQKMQNAVVAGFETGYTSICIIGTDCLELTPEVITEAFEELESVDAVIGPATDGGYYLLGMKKPHSQIFSNKNWSTHSVLRETIDDFEALNLLYVKLEELRDVDTEDDLPDELKD
ncbi:MAG: TIGR04282 family arsenosugar biosynthesis glycosyltransferase [Cyclobacteriaceae bacterium]